MQKIENFTPRRRLNMSGSSTDSMDVEFAAGLCENLAPAGMDGRESTRIRTPVKTPKRFRSASSPFASPMSDDMLTDSPKMESPLSPLVGSSPIVGTSKGLHRYGFKVIRKRRATVQDTCSKNAGISGGVRSLACSSPIRKTPKRDVSLARAGVRMDFAQPFPPREKRMTEQDYVLQEDNLVSSPDDEVFAQLSEAPIVTDLIKRRPTNLPGNDRRPSALISRRNQSRDHKLGESPVSYRTKRCMSLCSPGMMNSRMRGLRERNRSVNDYNIPKKDLNPALMDQPDLTGDFKRMLSLPSTTSGKHQDLKYINGTTLVDLQNGLHNVEATIIDARYPYEYKGGHIKGAMNLYTVEMVQDYFFGPNGLANQNMENVPNENDPTGSSKKRVIVFHCEFSSERAPAMLRFLRKLDRAKNRYPALDFPELYLLKDGYKAFFYGKSTFESTTGTYLPMLDTRYTQELRRFRKKCKTLPPPKI